MKKFITYLKNKLRTTFVYTVYSTINNFRKKIPSIDKQRKIFFQKLTQLQHERDSQKKPFVLLVNDPARSGTGVFVNGFNDYLRGQDLFHCLLLAQDLKERRDDPRTLIYPSSHTFSSKDRKLLSSYRSPKEGSLFNTELGKKEHTAQIIRQINPDIIHFNWNHMTLNIEDIPSLALLNKPIVWTLHDMGVFSGGCHCNMTDSGEFCKKYETHCANCPFVEGEEEEDISYRTFERKLKSYKDQELTIVCPSNWLADMARRSAVFKDKTIHVIPNGIDCTAFALQGKDFMRKKHKLPEERKLILIGSAYTGKFKGTHFLVDIINKLPYGKTELSIVHMGKRLDREMRSRIKYDIHSMGEIASLDKQKKAEIYSACDVFLTPTMIESYGLMIMESLSCSLPVVAFDVTAMPEAITHKKMGYLARPFDLDDMAQGIEWVLENTDYETLGLEARTHALRFDETIVYKHYVDLYKRLLNDRS